MIGDFFYNHVWWTALIWAVVYSSDYFLTIVGAKYYYGGINEKIKYEAGYELNPEFREDIGALKYVSFKFILALVIIGGAIVLAKTWFYLPKPGFDFILGFFLLPEIFIHIRHLKNIVQFREFGKTFIVNGTIDVALAYSMKLDKVEFFLYSLLLLFIFFVSPHYLLLGGMFGCLGLSLSKWKKKALSFRTAKKSQPLDHDQS